MKKSMIVTHLDTAKNYAKLSKAHRSKVGCIFVKDGRITSIGINGTPPGWKSPNSDHPCEDDNDKTLPQVLHAEMNAMMKFLNSAETTDNSSVFVTHSPCIDCAIKLRMAKVKSVYFGEFYRCEDGIVYLYNNSIDIYHIEDDKIYAMHYDYINNEIVWSEL